MAWLNEATAPVLPLAETSLRMRSVGRISRSRRCPCPQMASIRTIEQSLSYVGCLGGHGAVDLGSADGTMKG